MTRHFVSAIYRPPDSICEYKYCGTMLDDDERIALPIDADVQVGGFLLIGTLRRKGWLQIEELLELTDLRTLTKVKVCICSKSGDSSYGERNLSVVQAVSA